MLLVAATGGSGMPGSFRWELTPLLRRIALGYGVVWALVAIASLFPPTAQLPIATGPAGFEVPLARPLGAALALTPPGVGAGGFAPWQLISAPLVHPPDGLGALFFGVLLLGFFAAPVERRLGRRGVFALWALGAAGGVAGAIVAGALLRPAQAIHYGFVPSALALTIVSCMQAPDAFVRLLLVVDVRQRWVAWGITALTAVTLLALDAPLLAGSSGGGWEIGGVLAGWLWIARSARERRARKVALKVVLDPSPPREILWH